MRRAWRVASPRILKPGEVKIANFLVSLDCPILVRSSGLLDMLRTSEPRALIGDFSLNVASSVAADIFLGLGLDRFTPTHDLNAAQVADLARAGHAVPAPMVRATASTMGAYACP